MRKQFGSPACRLSLLPSFTGALRQILGETMIGQTNFGADEGVRGEYSRIGAELAVMR